jgi:capsular exopolysaccharide synthesis family protein
MNEEESEHSEHSERRHQYQSRSSSKAHLLAKIHRYKNLLRKRWWVLAAGMALGLLVAAVLYRFQPSSFVSVGRMMVNMKLAIPEGNQYSEEASSFLGTQVALMQSAEVKGRAQAQVAALNTNLPPQKVALKVTVSPRTSIFVLQASGGNPKFVQLFLQACMEQFLDLKKQMRNRTSDSTVGSLAAEAVTLKADIQASEAELAEFQRTNSMLVVEQQGSAIANFLLQKNQQLADMHSEFELLQQLTVDQNLDRLGNALPKPNDTSEPAPGTTSGPGTAPANRSRPNNSTPNAASPNSTAQAATPGNAAPPSTGTANGGDLVTVDYFRAKQELMLRKAEMEDLAKFLRPKHPKIVALGEQIARDDRLLDIYRQQGGEQLESRKQILAHQIKNKERELEELNAQAQDLGRKSADYQKLKAKLDRTQALHDRLLATMQSLDVNKEVSPESVTIVEEASPALLANAQLSLQLPLGALVGLGMGIALLMLLDRLDDRVNSFTELQEIFDENVLVQIPSEKPQHKKEQLILIQPDDGRHAFVEGYRNLRSSLLFMADPGHRPRTLLLTSSIPNEGKSMTSANLAITMAQSGVTVLLVDADLRKGVLHDRFGLQANLGFTEVLAQELKWEEAVQTTSYAKLSILPRGGVTQRSSELFLSEVTKKFLKEASAKYDYVIIDTAPVMAADDVTTLAPLMDGVLFVIRAEFTSARVARASLDLLYQRQVHVMGLVFNAVRPETGDYYYYYKYKDYYTTYPSTSGGGRHGKKKTAAKVETEASVVAPAEAPGEERGPTPRPANWAKPSSNGPKGDGNLARGDGREAKGRQRTEESEERV